MAELLSNVQPPEWPRPRGYSNGLVTAGEGERVLFVAGMVGWRVVPGQAEGRFESDDLAEQFRVALENVLAVVRAAGGGPANVARMTVYVTDLPAYRASLAKVGEAWRATMGKHFPVMALVGVAGLVETRAKVEIEATCVLPARREEKS